ncbi:MAG: Asp-tRNA(Asn)/Glu-tRNA(Gln) amidotransferase subunit GatA [Alphaproteobacteria bacterium]|nr:Asp-tRNA(Asn)/Glu-tRNA(Gln) amidotransferase subunit GatA [Alphaproteobacteria bacterium]
MTDLTKLTIRQTNDGLRAKKFSAVELANAYIKNIEQNRHLNAFITESFDLTLSQAEKSDEKIAAGAPGDLEGIPLAFKDLFCTKNLRTTCASKILTDFVPTYESTVTQKLLDAGATTLGKTNMDEFAMGGTNTNSAFGPVINPYKKNNSDEDLVPGGSSGGSAAAVAANLCAGATGSDTGGSIRQPASFTNIVGIKPTYGRCSRYGMVAFASSLDQAGVFARDVADAALLLRVISGFDVKDSTSVNIAVPEFEKLLSSDLHGKKIGIPKEYFVADMPSEIVQLWNRGKEILQKNGAEIVEISLPHTEYAAAVYYVLAGAEASSNLARFDGVRYGFRAPEENLSLEQMYEKTRAQGFGAEVKRRILTGTYVLSAGYYDAYYKKAQRVRNLIRQDFIEAFKNVDAILAPTTPSAAFSIKESQTIGESDPVKIYLNDVFTIPVNLAGLPGISVPAGFDKDGLPLGLQVITKHFDEQTALDVALTLEKNHS